MKEVIIKFTPFVFKQTVFIKDGEHLIEQKVPQKEVAKFIAFCKDINTVHFFGNEHYAKKVKEECILKYQMQPNQVKFVFNR